MPPSKFGPQPRPKQGASQVKAALPLQAARAGPAVAGAMRSDKSTNPPPHPAQLTFRLHLMLLQFVIGNQNRDLTQSVLGGGGNSGMIFVR